MGSVPQGERSEPLLDFRTEFRQSLDIEMSERNLLTSGMCNLEGEIGYTSRAKIYPDGISITAANRAIFRLPGWESDRPKKSSGYRDIPQDIRDRDNLQRAQRRAASNLRDFALANDWKYFVTFTLDRSKVDRYDVKAMTMRLNAWLDNRVRRKGLRYIIVPELHKDGALHYHGLVNDCLPATDSGTISMPGSKKPRKPRSKKQREEMLEAGGHIVYNLPDWTYGYSTAIELYGEKLAAVRYVCKYITKAPEKIGGRWFYHSSNLNKPEIMYGYQEIDSLVDDAIIHLRESGLTDDEIASRISRMYSQVDSINLTLFTRTEFWEG